MILKTRLNGQIYEFRDLNDIMAKANMPKSADRLQGIAAESETERVAAKIVLANTLIKDIVENPAIPYDKDEVTRVGIDNMDRGAFDVFRNMTVSEAREWLFDRKHRSDDLKRFGKGVTGEVAAALAKIMSTMDLVYCSGKIHTTSFCNTEIGQEGTVSFRCQPNSTTDDPESILLGTMEGVTYGVGDACIGVNPVEDNFESTRRIAEIIYDFLTEHEVPTQISVLSHVTTQIDAVKKGVPLSVIFQSIAGNQLTNDNFGVTYDLMKEAYDAVKEYGWNKGPDLLYFETGQGSEVSIDADEGVDEMTLEARTYQFARPFHPFLANNVTGFIGPETIYNGKEMIRANLEDQFMGKLLGLPMGMDPTFTSHAEIDLDDLQIATVLLDVAGTNYFMGIPGGDDVMLANQETSYQDDATLREMLHKKPAPEFHKWMMKMGLMDEDGILTDKAGDASIFA